MRQEGLAPQTVRSFAQVVRTLCRFAHRQRLIEIDLTRDFEMPRVPQVVIRTFTNDQLQRVLAAPDSTKIGPAIGVAV